MFGLKKKTNKKNELIAVVDGKLIPIEKVNDPVFSQKMLGDGFAFDSIGDTVYSCADATVTMLFPSNHAIGLTLDNGLEILIHIGIDTVSENGKGFRSFCEQGQKVKAGQPLIQFDRTYLLGEEYDLTVIVIFTNKESYTSFTTENVADVAGGKSLVATYVI